MEQRISIIRDHLDYIISKYLNNVHLGIDPKDTPQANKIFNEIKKKILGEFVRDGTPIIELPDKKGFISEEKISEILNHNCSNCSHCEDVKKELGLEFPLKIKGKIIKKGSWKK